MLFLKISINSSTMTLIKLIFIKCRRHPCWGTPFFCKKIVVQPHSGLPIFFCCFTPHFAEGTPSAHAGLLLFNPLRDRVK